MSGWEGLHGLDYVFIGLVAFGMIRGIVRGLSKELLILVSIGVIVWASGRWYGELSAVLQRGGQLSPASCDMVAYGLLVAALFVALLLLRLLLKPLVKFSFRGPIERLGGGLIGALEAAIAGAAALIALSLIPDEGLHKTITEDSVVGSRLTAAFPKVYDRVAQRFSLPEIEALKPPAAGAPAAMPDSPASRNGDEGKAGMQDDKEADAAPGSGPREAARDAEEHAP